MRVLNRFHLDTHRRHTHTPIWFKNEKQAKKFALFLCSPLPPTIFPGYCGEINVIYYTTLSLCVFFFPLDVSSFSLPPFSFSSIFFWGSHAPEYFCPANYTTTSCTPISPWYCLNGCDLQYLPRMQTSTPLKKKKNPRFIVLEEGKHKKKNIFL